MERFGNQQQFCIIVLLIVHIGCGGAPSVGPVSHQVVVPTTVSKLAVTDAGECPTPAVEKGSFSHTRSRLIHNMDNDGQHSMQDVIAHPNTAVQAIGKFGYTALNKDLEDETIYGFTQAVQCSPWNSLGTTQTDSDGKARFSVTSPSTSGRFLDVDMVVEGDLTRSQGRVWSLAPGTNVVIVDIDGTLTVDDGEIFEEILLGDESTMWPNADKVIQHWVKQGVQPIYITGRLYPLLPKSKQWLDRLGFPKGPLKAAESISQAKPKGVRQFKLEQLNYLKDVLKLNIMGAYGNATTDICAYHQAGIPPQHTFIIGKHAGESCEGATAPVGLQNYDAHLAKLEREVE